MASLVCKLRGGIFFSMKTRILTDALRHTDKSTRPIVTMKFNLPSARAARQPEHVKVDGKYSSEESVHRVMEAL